MRHEHPPTYCGDRRVFEFDACVVFVLVCSRASPYPDRRAICPSQLAAAIYTTPQHLRHTYRFVSLSQYCCIRIMVCLVLLYLILHRQVDPGLLW